MPYVHTYLCSPLLYSYCFFFYFGSITIRKTFWLYVFTLPMNHFLFLVPDPVFVRFPFKLLTHICFVGNLYATTSLFYQAHMFLSRLNPIFSR